MDHKIHDDPDVQRPLGKLVESVAFDKEGISGNIFDRGKGTVETFDVPDLDLGILESADPDEFFSFFDRHGDRFLYKCMDAVIQEEMADFKVVDCRGADAYGIDFADQGAEIGKECCVKFAGDLLTEFFVNVANADNIDFVLKVRVCF